MKKKKKIAFYSSMVVFIVLIFVFFLPMRSFLNRVMNEEFVERVEKNALSANIQIVRQEFKYEGNASVTEYSPAASGVIIRKEGNKYYAITAGHVIPKHNTQLLVMEYNDLDFSYYEQFSQVVVEYTNEKYDLAVISFISDEDFAVLSIAEETPQYGEKVASMSNSNKKRNMITVGKIISRVPKPFGDKAGKKEYPIIKHTALTGAGSSGCGILNMDLEIVGINLGSRKNMLKQFIYGMAMPNNRILEFLEEWGH